MSRLNVNKYVLLSLLSVLINMIMFWTWTSSYIGLYTGIIIFSVLSIASIVFALLSRKVILIIIGVILNGMILVFTFFMLFSIVISSFY